jgi:hypothetical protein
MKQFLVYTSHDVLGEVEDFRTFEIEASNDLEARSIAEAKCFSGEWVTEVISLS